MLKNLNVKGLTVLVRCDFMFLLWWKNFQMIIELLQLYQSIKELISKGAKVFLMSHLGKIDYKKTPEEIEKAKKKNSLAPVAVRLAELLGQEVKFSPATHGEELKAAVESLHDGEVLLMQNTRYEKGESKNDPALSAEWASLCDAFVRMHLISS